MTAGGGQTVTSPWPNTPSIVNHGSDCRAAGRPNSSDWPREKRELHCPSRTSPDMRPQVRIVTNGRKYARLEIDLEQLTWR